MSSSSPQQVMTLLVIDLHTTVPTRTLSTFTRDRLSSGFAIKFNFHYGVTPLDGVTWGGPPLRHFHPCVFPYFYCMNVSMLY